MRRISTATKVVDKFGAGKHGFTNGSAVGGIAATDLEDLWFDHVQEELSAIVEAGGGAVDGSGTNQVYTALLALFATKASVTASAPPGAILHFGMTTAPAGWLKANGALVSRTTYAALFAAIGTTFGAGDGATTFKLPDLRGEFLRGWDDGRGVDSSRVFGSAQADDFKSHTHAWGGNSENSSPGAGAPSHTGGFNPTSATGGTETRPRNIALLACIKY